ncbi:serine threonine- kinase ATG1c [Olea europaea subsp. europaea]|uniref:Serine threonine- kinase ATG1c n=1 Tax=Olea europaea subsp. europaea TaxID=158383 RepID=A0A8S0VH02_OLEEU|nr:serine threonine- kinase ATG1c [Olea europaea subsp. europaea]
MAPEIMQVQKYDAKISEVLAPFNFSLSLGKPHIWGTISYKKLLRCNPEESPGEDCFLFGIDDDSSGPDKCPSSVRSCTVRYTCGFSLNSKPDRRELSNLSNKMDFCSGYSNASCKPETIGSGLGSQLLSEGNLKVSLKTTDPGSVNCNLELWIWRIQIKIMSSCLAPQESHLQYML